MRWSGIPLPSNMINGKRGRTVPSHDKAENEEGMGEEDDKSCVGIS